MNSALKFCLKQTIRAKSWVEKQLWSNTWRLVPCQSFYYIYTNSCLVWKDHLFPICSFVLSGAYFFRCILANPMTLIKVDCIWLLLRSLVNCSSCLPQFVCDALNCNECLLFDERNNLFILFVSSFPILNQIELNHFNFLTVWANISPLCHVTFNCFCYSHMTKV